MEYDLTPKYNPNFHRYMQLFVKERKEQGLSVEELAKKADIPVQELIAMENGYCDAFFMTTLASVKIALNDFVPSEFGGKRLRRVEEDMELLKKL